MPEIQSRPCFLTPGQLKPHYPLFVFLPGMDGTGQLLRLQTAGLEMGFDVRCLVIPADDLTSWEHLTDEVLSLIEQELSRRPSRSVYLCGESFGGCLAIKVALKAPHLFDRIILVNPATSFNRQPLLRLGAQLSNWIPEFLFGSSTIALLPFLANLGRMAPRDRRDLLNAMKSVPPKTVTWRVSMVSEFDVDEMQLQCLTQPVVVIAGAADQLLPSVDEAQRLINYFPNAKMVALPQSGHACLLETDVNLFEILKQQDFLGHDVPNQMLIRS